jgi:glycosyltransferase involved in cell wall biosynthesis
MNVLALQRQSHVAQGVASLSVSARVTEVLEYLKHSNSGVTFVSLSESDDLSTKAIEWADALILSKHSSKEAIDLTLRAKKRGIKVIYDVDDWIFSFPSYSAGNRQNEKIGNIKYLIELSDYITVANDILLTRLSDKYPNVFLVPNGMWVEKYNQRSVGCLIGIEDRRPRIVFTNADLIKMQKSKDALFTALQVFFTKNNKFVLDFFGDPFPEMSSLPFLHYTNRMPYDSYMQALVSGGYLFSISPLGAEEDVEELEFNECKNPFKYLNYGAARVPGIYSASTIYKKCILNGKNGLLVENNYKSWLEALNTMAFDRELRDVIRTHAYDDVKESYHIRHSATALLNILTRNK